MSSITSGPVSYSSVTAKPSLKFAGKPTQAPAESKIDNSPKLPDSFKLNLWDLGLAASVVLPYVPFVKNLKPLMKALSYASLPLAALSIGSWFIPSLRRLGMADTVTRTFGLSNSYQA